jgi:putative ABC transport system substrate-binding protein
VVAGAASEKLNGEGLAKSMNRPGGRVTGVSPSAGNMDGKALQLLKETAPRTHRVAFLASPPYPLSPPDTEAAVRALNLRPLPVLVADPGEFDKAFDSIRKTRIDALFVGGSPFFWTHRSRIIEFAARERLPAMYWYRGFAESGGLMSYGVDWVDLYRHAGAYVNKILKGAQPGDLPIEQPTTFELI